MEKANSSSRNHPVAESQLEIADTFQDAGTRPIEESPDYLVLNQESLDNSRNEDIPVTNSKQSEINSVPPLD